MDAHVKQRKTMKHINKSKLGFVNGAIGTVDKEEPELPLEEDN